MSSSSSWMNMVLVAAGSLTARKQRAGYGGRLPPGYFSFHTTQIIYPTCGGRMFLCTVGKILDWKVWKPKKRPLFQWEKPWTPENPNLWTFYGSLQPEYTHHKGCSRWLWGAVWDLQTMRIIKWIIQDNCVGYPTENHQQTWHKPPVSLPTYQ